MMPGPLSGQRIIDFTWAWAGPYGAMLLSFLGAEVIKVESATRLDHARQRSLAFGDFQGSINQTPMFNELNLNKQSLSLNLKEPAAQQIVKELAAVSDGSIDNFRPGTLDKLGLGYDTLSAINADFVMVSAGALGGGGPERFYVGYAPTFAALGGLSYLTGFPGGPPMMMGGAIDLRAGTSAAFVMLAALLYRDRSGRGQFVDASSREAIAMHLGEEFLAVSLNGRDSERHGNGHHAYAPHDVYACGGADDAEWVAIACRTDGEWEALCHASGLVHLLEDARFRTGLRRWKHRAELNREIESWTRARSAREAATILIDAGVPASASLSGADVYRDPHFQARLNGVPVKPAELDERLTMAPPWRLSLTPPAICAPAPTLGQHTREVLQNLLGYPPARIDDLQAAGALD